MNFLKEYVNEKEVKLAIVGTVIGAICYGVYAIKQHAKDAKNLECSLNIGGIILAELKLSK